MTLCEIQEPVKFDETKWCVGCGRSLDDIAEWKTASMSRKKEIIQAAKIRKKKS